MTYVGNSFKLEYGIVPDINSTLAWCESSDWSVAGVSSDGTVTSYKPGTATITLHILTADGENLEASITFTFVNKEPETNIALGDVDSNGKVNAIDASAVLKEYASISIEGAESFTSDQKTAADVNKDGKVDARDASMILKYYAYLSTLNEEPLDMESWMATQ